MKNTAFFLALLFLQLLLNACQQNSTENIIKKAGNTEDEKERYSLLLSLKEKGISDPALEEDLDTLLTYINFWANNTYRPEEPRKLASENSYLAGYFYEQFDESDLDFAPVDSTSPLYPIYCIYRGRMLIHSVVQNNRFTEEWLKKGRELLEIAHEEYPQNRIIAMYLDNPIEGWPREYPANSAAPDWANLQRESLEKMTDIVYWWIENRQLPNGEFGGGWGDDCEMWRWWAPVMIGFEDTGISNSHTKFSNAIFDQPHLEKGYTNIMWDVEHTSEDTSDPITSMLHIAPDDSVWTARALRILELMQTKWMGINNENNLQFKSAFMTSEEVLDTGRTAYEIHYHQRVAQPVLLYWLRTRKPELTDYLSKWYETWVEASEKTEGKKPGGLLPVGIGWPEGNLNQPGREWNSIVMNYDFGWPGTVRNLYFNLLQTYYLTGDEKFLEPVLKLFRFRRSFLEGNMDPDGQQKELAAAMKSFGKIGPLVIKYRAISSDTSYDKLLLEDAGGYTLYLLTGQDGLLKTELEKSAKAFRRNWPSYTSEVRWTDRILSYNQRYFSRYDTSTCLPDNQLLYSMVTGDPGLIDYFPLNAVRWHTTPRELAILVKNSDSRNFTAEAFNFSGGIKNIDPEFFLLAPGRYRLRMEYVSPVTEPEIFRDKTIQITANKRLVPMDLPAGKLVKISLEEI